MTKAEQRQARRIRKQYRKMMARLRRAGIIVKGWNV